MLKRETKDAIIKEYAIKEGDTGSVEVQVALLTEEIKVLTEHLKTNIHDFHSKRGLLIKVGKRKTMGQVCQAPLLLINMVIIALPVLAQALTMFEGTGSGMLSF